MSPAVPLVRHRAAILLVFFFLSTRARADVLNLTLNPEQGGPFPAAVGGMIDFTVAVEIFDSEGDGPDTQGLDAVGFDVLTNTGLTLPQMFAAPTGESGISGVATVEDERYAPSDSSEPLFVGGYGFVGGNLGFRGTQDQDDLLGFGGTFSLVWLADVQSNAPGLQPLALAGIGYGERPAGGDWLFAEGQIPIPTDPGSYTVDLVPYTGSYLLAGIDLTVDHESGFRGAFDPQDLMGDSFSFTVVPEPGSFLLLVVGAIVARQCERGSCKPPPFHAAIGDI